MVCVCVYQYSNEQTAVSLVASRWNLLILVVHVVESRTNLPGRAGGARPLYTDSRQQTPVRLARHPGGENGHPAKTPKITASPSYIKVEKVNNKE